MTPQSSLRDRWYNWPADLRKPVEDLLGLFPHATLADVPDAAAQDYAITDAIATRQLWNHISQSVDDRKLWNLYDIDMSIVPFLAECQRVGMLVNKPHFASLSTRLQGMMDTQLKSITDIIHAPLNPDSPDEVAALLFSQMEIHKGSGIKLKRTKSGHRYRADDDALQAVKHLHPIVPLIQEYRSVSKLKSFSDSIPLVADQYDRVHTHFKLTRVPSGRLASADINLQQIPTRTELSKEIRKGFIAPSGCLIVSMDFSSIEPRWSAHLSGDPTLIDVFVRGVDLYTTFAAGVFGKSYADVDKAKERTPCKNAVLGIYYGETSLGLSEQLIAMGLPEYTEDRCDDLIAEFFKMFPGVKRRIDEQHSHARLYGWVEDYFGRRLWCPQVWSSNTKIRQEALRLVQNFDCQAPAATTLKLATAKAWEVLKQYKLEGLNVKPLMSIHDELLFELPEAMKDRIEADMVPCFETAVKLKVPVKCGVAFAKDWGSLDK